MFFYDLLAGIPPYGWGFRLCGKPFCPIAAPATRKAGSHKLVLAGSIELRTNVSPVLPEFQMI